MLDFYNVYKEKILQFILYRFQRLIGISSPIKVFIGVILNKLSKNNWYYTYFKYSKYLESSIVN